MNTLISLFLTVVASSAMAAGNEPSATRYNLHSRWTSPKWCQ